MESNVSRGAVGCTFSAGSLVTGLGLSARSLALASTYFLRQRLSLLHCNRITCPFACSVKDRFKKL